jgi:hypothetical protein
MCSILVILMGILKYTLFQGTPPFIANTILLQLERHQDKHDLESIFYAFIYALTVFKGPYGPCTAADYEKLHSAPSVLKWFDIKVMQQSLRDIAWIKLGHLADFQCTIINKTDTYLKPLRDFLLTLHQEAFEPTDRRYTILTHEKMLKLFDDEYHRLVRLESKSKMNEERAEEHLRDSKKRRV